MRLNCRRRIRERLDVFDFPMNRLAKEQSVYLRHAAAQKIDWYPWSDAPFEAAARENKPVLLSSGAAWCHWCHVMAAESFEDNEIAAILNKLFICVKLDRDERPDIDRRYQQAVGAMGSGSGWPLTVFLTPDRKPFFGGTYFPPEDRMGRPSFRKILAAVSDHYRTKKEDAESFAASVMDALKPEALYPGQLEPGLLDHAEKSLLDVFDPRNGGFGSSPKFPMPGAIEFLMRQCSQPEGTHQEAGDAVRKTLMAMMQGGFHDQIGGGFHRYSVDEAWIIPHFEKMADDNAGLLKNYTQASAVFRDEQCREAVESIIAFTSTDLVDPAGGFFASQDADVTPSDEGGYFTWTEAELKEVLTPEEFDVITLNLLHPSGAMHHDPSKRVLAVHRVPGDIAEAMGKEPGAVAAVISSAKSALLKRRMRRTAPLIDRSLYTSLNGMLIAAYFQAYLVFDDHEYLEVAVKSLERIMRERTADSKVLHTAGVTGLLDDYVHLIDAFISGYEATGDQLYVDRAEKIMAQCFDKFLDEEEGGFFDTEEAVLGLRLKRIEDVPHASANALAILLMLKLFVVTGKERYRNEAERSLRIFAPQAAEMGVHAGTFFCALHAYFNSASITIEAGPRTVLARQARIAAVRSLAAIKYGEDNDRVISCFKGVCHVSTAA